MDSSDMQGVTTPPAELVGDPSRPAPPGVGAPSRPVDEDDLVRRAPSDADAFTELYRFYLPRIHAFAYRRSGSMEVAEDITAATFERALRNIDRFRPRGGGFGAWLYRIAANQLNDHHRRSGRERSDRGQRAIAMLNQPAVAPEDEVLADYDRARVLTALSRIPPRYQRAISLRYLADLDNESAAEAMGISRSTMAVVLHRALKALRRELESAA